MATMHPIRKQVAAPEIPDKLYFRIGDVARLLEVPAYVLRFWETEFPQLKPNKGGTGQRLYRKRDVETALRIKSLLYDQGFTIPGARQVFKQEARSKEAAAVPFAAPAEEAAPAAAAPVTTFNELKLQKQIRALQSEMRQLLNILSKPVSPEHPSVASKVKAMRPRLVLEPRPEKPKLPTLLPVRQPGLFGFDDDPGPMAS